MRHGEVGRRAGEGQGIQEYPGIKHLVQVPTGEAVSAAALDAKNLMVVLRLVFLSQSRRTKRQGLGH